MTANGEIIKKPARRVSGPSFQVFLVSFARQQSKQFPCRESLFSSRFEADTQPEPSKSFHAETVAVLPAPSKVQGDWHDPLEPGLHQDVHRNGCPLCPLHPTAYFVQFTSTWSLKHGSVDAMTKCLNEKGSVGERGIDELSCCRATLRHAGIC